MNKIPYWKTSSTSLGLILAGLFPGVASAQAVQETGSVPADDVSLQDIVVTALRREQNLKDVPVAVTALSQETLTQANIRDTRDLQTLTPGLRMDVTGQYLQPALRGVTSTLLNIANDPNVATYVDGVYQQFNVGAIYDLPDVTSVQVLKGPQGTLFGRNATGGAILITSEEPSFNTHGMMSVSYARYNEVVAKGFVSAPLVGDTIAASISGAYRRRDGFVKNLLTGENVGDLNSYVVRGKLLLRPWEGARFVLTGSVSRRHDPNLQLLTVLNGNYACRVAAPSPSPCRTAIPANLIPDRPYTVASDTRPDIITKTYGVNLNGKIDVGEGNIEITSAYTKMNMPHLLFDSDLGPNIGNTDVQHLSSRVFTQEVLYNSDPSKPLKVTVGAFYFNFAGGIHRNVNNGAQLIATDDKTNAFAAFGEATLDVTDRLSLLAGARYSTETRVSNAVRVLGTTVEPATIPRLGRKTFNAVTPRVSALFKLNESTNAYVTVSKGFKSGAFNSSALQADAVNPEKITAYEAGIKTVGHHFNLNISGFYYNYSDLQVGQLTQVGSVFIQTFENAAKSRIYGLEMDGAWRVSDAFKLTGGLSWLHARYDSYPGAVVVVPVTASPQPTGAAACNFTAYTPLNTGNRTVTCDVGGKNMIKAPDWSGSLSATYMLDTSAGDISLSGTVYATSRIFYDPLNRVSQAPYATLSARLAFRPSAVGGLEVAVFGTNLTDRRILSGVVESTLWDAVAYEAPVSIGVEAKLRF